MLKDFRNMKLLFRISYTTHIQRNDIAITETTKS